MEEANKKTKTMACCYEEHDRLSNLVDDLIFHILSFLSTKESHRTCVLSKRWGSICTKIPDLHFELSEIPDPMSSKEIQSVYAALLRRTENITRLSLDSEKGCQPKDVHMWVSKALDLKVHELDLRLILHEKTLLPLRLSTSESLVVLKLNGKIQPKLNSSLDVYLPSLKILHLESTMKNSIIDDHREYDLNNFLSGCPHLEELLLDEIFLQPINIFFLSLKRLCLSLIMPISASHIGPVQINSPLLEDLCIIEFSLTPRTYEFVNSSNLNRAILCMAEQPDFNSLYTLLKGFSNVKSLTLGFKTFHYLTMEDKLDKLHLTFHNLLLLLVEISENYNWSMLVSFLQNAPKLKDLVIKKSFKIDSERKEVGNLSWVGPSITPTCLLTSRITFKFIGIQNIKIELDFTLYIINHSTKLEKVKILTPDSEKVLKRSLLMESKKSSQRKLIQFEDELDAVKDSIKTTP